jgi:hypothetical protein
MVVEFQGKLARVGFLILLAGVFESLCPISNYFTSCQGTCLNMYYLAITKPVLHVYMLWPQPGECRRLSYDIDAYLDLEFRMSPVVFH